MRGPRRVGGWRAVAGRHGDAQGLIAEPEDEGEDEGTQPGQDVADEHRLDRGQEGWCGRLQALGHDYGDFDAHNGLWEMAEKTAHDGLARMALVPRVLEARGLDVTPGMIVKLRSLGDTATVAILELILREEVAHVAAGSRWFRWHCERRGIDPEPKFRELLAEYARAVLHGPFNIDARSAAGFSEDELAALQQLSS